MIINVDERKYKKVEEDYKNSILDGIIKNYEEFKRKNPEHKIFNFLKRDMLELIIKNPFLQKTNSFLEGYLHTVSLICLNQNLFKSIWDYYKDELIKNSIKRNEFYMICRYYSIKTFNNKLIDTIITKNKNQYFKNNTNYEELINEVIEELDSYSDALKKIFNYNNEMTTDRRSDILKQIGINVCPYCHRQFINSYMVNGKNRVIAQLDHFIPKDKYPLYALSLYNFIPSCAHCNTVLKKEKVFPFLFPVSETNNNNKIFSITYRDYQSIIGSKNNFDIKIINPEENILKKQIRNFQIKSLATEELYSYHKNFISDLLMKKNIDNQEYKDFVSSFGSSDKLSDKDFNEFLYGFNFQEEELYNKPLSKLATDVIKRK